MGNLFYLHYMDVMEWRNLAVCDNSFVWPKNAWQQIRTKAKEVQDNLRRHQRPMKQEMLIAWQPPQHSFVKLNVDGSVTGQPSLVASRGLLRDENGRWILGFTYKVGISFALMSELWALYWGLKLCWDKGYKKVQVESTHCWQFKNDQIITPTQIRTSICSRVSQNSFNNYGIAPFLMSIVKQINVQIGQPLTMIIYLWGYTFMIFFLIVLAHFHLHTL